jgi:hypothetical protein
MTTTTEHWDVDGRQVEVRVTAYTTCRMPMFQYATKGNNGWLETQAHAGWASEGQKNHEDLIRFAIERGLIQ